MVSPTEMPTVPPERTDEREDGGAHGHILQRHRGLEGDERRLEETAHTETSDEQDELLLRGAGILLEHNHEALQSIG